MIREISGLIREPALVRIFWHFSLGEKIRWSREILNVVEKPNREAGKMLESVGPIAQLEAASAT